MKTNVSTLPQIALDNISQYLKHSYCLDPFQEIAVLLSGGVDSSVVLASLVHFGCQNISAYYLKIWLNDDAQFLSICPWEEDLEYASAICEQLGVPLHIIPMQKEYYQSVVKYTLSELKMGRTPSPDLLCNQYIKFGVFADYLHSNRKTEGELLIASGHYAKLFVSRAKRLDSKGNSQIFMQQAPDLIKDQTYFLSRLTQQQLRHLIFPLGCVEKSDVRKIAKYLNLATANRKDSQGICFLGKIKFRDFVSHYLGESPGSIVDIDTKKVLGEHLGLWFYTIGQRQGLSLGGGPWYVYTKDIKKKILYLRHADSHQKYASKMIKRFWVDEVSWIFENPPFLISQKEYALIQSSEKELLEHSIQEDVGFSMKLRHGPNKVDCNLNFCDTDLLEVSMSIGEKGVAPGQFAVFYWGSICLGSGMIRYTENDMMDTTMSMGGQ